MFLQLLSSTRTSLRLFSKPDASCGHHSIDIVAANPPAPSCKACNRSLQRTGFRRARQQQAFERPAVRHHAQSHLQARLVKRRCDTWTWRRRDKVIYLPVCFVAACSGLRFFSAYSQSLKIAGRFGAWTGTERTLTYFGRSYKSKSAFAASGFQIAALGAAPAQTWAEAKSSIRNGRKPCIEATQCC